MSDEVLSGLKLLVAVAKADGVVHENERLAIQSALDDIELPEYMMIDSLLATDVDVDAELALIKSSEVKRQTFASACALAYVDGEASDVERALLEKMRAAFALGAASGDAAGAGADAEQVATSERVKHVLERAFAPLASGDTFNRRDVAIDDEIRRFAVLGGVLASLPLPAFCEGIDCWNDVRLARKIGTFYGRGSFASGKRSLTAGGKGSLTGDTQYWLTFVNNVVGSAGSWLAVSLLARLVPTSSRVAGAYASTYALGKTTKLYFEKSEVVETDVLRSTFKDAKKEGAGLAKDTAARDAMDAKKAVVEKAKTALDAELATAKITENEYMEKLVSLD